MLILSSCTSGLKIITLKDHKTIEGIKTGMSIESAVKKANNKFHVEQSEMQISHGDPCEKDLNKKYEYIVYPDESKQTVLFSFNAGFDDQTKDRVFRLVIRNPKYHTTEGIYIGMTMKELREKTGLRSVDFNYDDGLFIISDVFDGGFLMDITSVKNDFYKEEPRINTLPDELLIKEIIFF